MDKTASLALAANQSMASSVPVTRTMDLISVESFERMERNCEQQPAAYIDLDDSLYDDVSESRVNFSNTFERVDFILKQAKTIKTESSSRNEENSIYKLDDCREQSIPVLNTTPSQASRQTSLAPEIPHPRFINNLELPRPRASETQLEDVSCPSMLLQNSSTFGPPLTSSSMIDKSVQNANQPRIFVSADLFPKPTLPEAHLPTLVENVASMEHQESLVIKKEHNMTAFGDMTIPSQFLRESIINDHLMRDGSNLVNLMFPSRILEESRLPEKATNKNSERPAVLHEVASKNLTTKGAQDMQSNSSVVASETPPVSTNVSRSSAVTALEQSPAVDSLASVGDRPPATVNPSATTQEQQTPPVSNPPASVQNSLPVNAQPTPVDPEQASTAVSRAAALGINPRTASMPAVQRHVLSNVLINLERRPEDFEKLNPVIGKDVFVGSIEQAMRALEASEPQAPSVPNSVPVVPALAEPVSLFEFTFCKF